MAIEATAERNPAPGTGEEWLRYRDAQFVYDPYPIGTIAQVFLPQTYAQLVDAWPAQELFQFKANLGNKYSLSEVNNPERYHAFLKSSPHWLGFYKHVKSQAFVDGVLDMLCNHHIDLGLRGRRVSALNQSSSWDERLRAIPDKLSRLRRAESSLSVRFEFSMMPADGGSIKPHTDAPQKLITIVLSMVRPGEWNPAHGGGTSMLRPKDVTRSFNHLNKQASFDDMEIIHTFEFLPNQCLIFVKTFNSWHSVSPMTGAGANAMRKTLTINIESWGW
jgi:hypothetical protein